MNSWSKDDYKFKNYTNPHNDTSALITNIYDRFIGAFLNSKLAGFEKKGSLCPAFEKNASVILLQDSIYLGYLTFDITDSLLHHFSKWREDPNGTLPNFTSPMEASDFENLTKIGLRNSKDNNYPLVASKNMYHTIQKKHLLPLQVNKDRSSLFATFLGYMSYSSIKSHSSVIFDDKSSRGFKEREKRLLFLNSTFYSKNVANQFLKKRAEPYVTGILFSKNTKRIAVCYIVAACHYFAVFNTESINNSEEHSIYSNFNSID